jgi:hypothetical protein
MQRGRSSRRGEYHTEGERMARKQESIIKGTFNHRRTESEYMRELLDAVPLEEWREIVVATVAAAKAGDASARAWLAQYLVGKPGATAPAPLTVVVQQLSGFDPVAEELVKPELERTLFPTFHSSESTENALRARIVAELRALEVQKSDRTETPENVERATHLRKVSAG